MIAVPGMTTLQGPMYPTFVGATSIQLADNSACTTSASVSLTINYPAGTKVGDMIFCVTMFSDPASGVSYSPDNFTQSGVLADQNIWQVFHFAWDGVNSGVTISATGTNTQKPPYYYLVAYMVAYRGCYGLNGTDPVVHRHIIANNNVAQAITCPNTAVGFDDPEQVGRININVVHGDCLTIDPPQGGAQPTISSAGANNQYPMNLRYSNTTFQHSFSFAGDQSQDVIVSVGWYDTIIPINTFVTGPVSITAGFAVTQLYASNLLLRSTL